ncbi:hypothetical protein AMTR_s04785p00002600 [Amborella trichopoda]|uniref:Uncharacterized protein n=1 Tax=Amborella trichopoda TaxID=13333 RepID=U5CVU1_AMBTC|nr:hypothetical protein AMTR_s04785p00002600 [Amborella trichopoda]
MKRHKTSNHPSFVSYGPGTSVLRSRTEQSRIGFDRKDCASATGETVAPSSAYGSAVVETKRQEASS